MGNDDIVSVSVAQCRPTPKARTRGEDGGRRMTNSALDASPMSSQSSQSRARFIY